MSFMHFLEASVRRHNVREYRGDFGDYESQLARLLEGPVLLP